jgi:hypothetical protein
MLFGYEAERRKMSKLKGTDYLLFGIFGQWMGGILIAVAPHGLATAPLISGELVVILSTGVLIGGCAMFARFHRLNRAWAMLGLFNLPGVLMLMLLTIQWRQGERGHGFSVIFAEPYRRDVWRMDVRVVLAENTGVSVREPIMVQLPRGCNVGTAMKTLAGVIPGLIDGDLPQANFTINGARASRRDELSHGDEMIVSIVSGTVEAKGEATAVPDKK